MSPSSHSNMCKSGRSDLCTCSRLTCRHICLQRLCAMLSISSSATYLQQRMPVCCTCCPPANPSDVTAAPFAAPAVPSAPPAASAARLLRTYCPPAARPSALDSVVDQLVRGARRHIFNNACPSAAHVGCGCRTLGPRAECNARRWQARSSELRVRARARCRHNGAAPSIRQGTFQLWKVAGRTSRAHPVAQCGYAWGSIPRLQTLQCICTGVDICMRLREHVQVQRPAAQWRRGGRESTSISLGMLATAPLLPSAPTARLLPALPGSTVLSISSSAAYPQQRMPVCGAGRLWLQDAGSSSRVQRAQVASAQLRAPRSRARAVADTTAQRLRYGKVLFSSGRLLAGHHARTPSRSAVMHGAAYHACRRFNASAPA